MNRRQKEFVIVGWINSCKTADQLKNLDDKGYSAYGPLAFEKFYQKKKEIAPELKLRVRLPFVEPNNFIGIVY